MDTPYGPREIGKNRQVTLPKQLMDRVELKPLDQVYVAANDDLPGTLVLVPLEMYAEWIRRGRASDQAQVPPSVGTPGDD